jgi:phosphate transport system substrate-binding protein
MKRFQHPALAPRMPILIATVVSLFSFLMTPSQGFASVSMNGAGATFPYPLYSKWFSEFRKLKPEAQINYQSIGSGGGIRQLMAKTVDFGASDAPMTDAQLAQVQPPIIHLPTVLGAVVLTYQIPGFKGELKLSSEVVSDIYLGKITKWNDSKLVALNPGVPLPSDSILVVHRSDGSGTTAIFSDWLSKTQMEWKSKVGTGTALKWPVGIGGKGNEGVTSLVKQTPGAIGYVEWIYAKTNGLPSAAMLNSAGQMISPSARSVSAAAESELKKIPADFRISITDAGGKASYPVSGFTYLLVPSLVPAAKQAVLTAFLKWALTDGQKMAEPLAYAPLPGSLTQKVLLKVNEIKPQ